MEHTHSILTPMDPNVKLDLAEDWGEKELEDITDYQAVVGSLMYAAVATRPDISYAVSALSCCNSLPFTSHTTSAKRVLQYIKSTADFRLHFTSNGIGIGIGSDNCLIGYSDSDWAMTAQTTNLRDAMCFSPTMVEQSGGSLRSKASLPCQLLRPNLSPVWRPPEKGYGHSNYRKTFTEKTYHSFKSTVTIKKLSLSLPRESSRLGPNTSTVVTTIVEIGTHAE